MKGITGPLVLFICLAVVILTPLIILGSRH